MLLDKLLVLSLGYGLLFLAIVAAGLGHVIIATLHNPRQTLTHLRTIQRGCFWLFSWLKVRVMHTALCTDTTARSSSYRVYLTLLSRLGRLQIAVCIV